MPELRENLTDCEISSVIHFLNLKDVKAAENYVQIKEGNGEYLRNGRKMVET